MLGLEERYDGVITGDFLEAMREFVTRIDSFLKTLESERSESGLPLQTLTGEHCVKGSQNADWEGKLIIVMPDILSPEYRSAEHQLALCTGGFEAKAEASGRAVYIEELYSGKKCRYNRSQIAGIADPSKLPEWAKTKLAALNGENEKPQKPATFQEKFDNAKKKAAEQDAAKKDGRTKKSKNNDERE